MKNERTTIDHLSTSMRWKLWENGLRRTQLFDSITWLKKNPQELYQRIADFEGINAMLSGYMCSQEDLRRELRDVSKFRTWYRGSVLPRLHDLHYSNNGAGVNGTIETLLNEAAASYPEWAVVNEEYPSPATPAMGALIEGYGRLLGRLKSGTDPELESTISRNYVLGFEEVLLTQKPESPLVADVMGFVLDEYDTFQWAMRIPIQKAALGFNQRMKQEGQQGQV